MHAHWQTNSPTQPAANFSALTRSSSGICWQRNATFAADSSSWRWAVLPLLAPVHPALAGS